MKFFPFFPNSLAIYSAHLRQRWTSYCMCRQILANKYIPYFSRLCTWICEPKTFYVNLMWMSSVHSYTAEVNIRFFSFFILHVINSDISLTWFVGCLKTETGSASGAVSVFQNCIHPQLWLKRNFFSSDKTWRDRSSSVCPWGNYFAEVKVIGRFPHRRIYSKH